MKKLLLTALLLALLLSSCADTKETNNSEASTPSQQGSAAVDTSDVTMETADLQALYANSRLTMVNVWATTCPPCINEMPDLGALAAEYDPAEFQIIGVVADTVDMTGTPSAAQVEAAKRIVVQTGANYTHVLPDAEMLGGLLRDVQVVPTTFFFDSEGNLVGEVLYGSRSKSMWTTEIGTRLEGLDNA